MLVKIPCGGFYIDDESMSLEDDGVLSSKGLQPPSIPTLNGHYTLEVDVSNGESNYVWTPLVSIESARFEIDDNGILNISASSL